MRRAGGEEGGSRDAIYGDGTRVNMKMKRRTYDMLRQEEVTCNSAGVVSAAGVVDAFVAVG